MIVSARRDKGYVPVAHSRGVTPQYFKDGTPRKARTLLGCDVVAHRLRSCATRHSLLLVSLQNYLWQMVNSILRQPQTKMIFGTGIDIVDIEKMKRTIEKWGKHFEKKIFTPLELNYCYQKKTPFPHLAARFAAKEAFLKALTPTQSRGNKNSHEWGGRKGGGYLKWKEIEIDNYQGGQPFYRLKGSINSWVNREKIRTFLTISHTGNYAIAHCLLEK